MKQQKLKWSALLLDNGARKSQNTWKTWLSVKKNNPLGWRLPTQAEYVSKVREILKEQETPFKRQFFKDLRECYLMTSETLPCLDGQERALVLGVNIYDRFNIDASDDIGDDGPARGVRVVKKKPVNIGKKKVRR